MGFFTVNPFIRRAEIHYLYYPGNCLLGSSIAAVKNNCLIPVFPQCFLDHISYLLQKDIFVIITVSACINGIANYYLQNARPDPNCAAGK